MFEPGTLLAERFEIKGELGRGGSATVYLAEDRETEGSQVALKVLHAQLGNEEVLRSRMGREVMACRRLSHANILPVYELHGAQGQVFLSMAYHPGQSLSEVLQGSGPMDIEAVRALGMAVASALQEAHLKGVLHRDVKPQNLMIDDAGTVQLTDFGLARLGDMATVTATDQLLGTPGYVPPEVLMGERWEPRGDVYGLGVVLYQALTGQMPFRGMSTLAVLRAQGEGPPPSPSTLRPEVPQWMDELVTAMLKPRPDERPGGASAVYGALEERRGPVESEEAEEEEEAEEGGAALPVVADAQAQTRSLSPEARSPIVVGEGDLWLYVTGRTRRGASWAESKSLDPALAKGVVEVLSDQGYVVPEGFEEGLVVMSRTVDRGGVALLTGLDKSTAGYLVKRLKGVGVKSRISGYHLGPLYKAQLSPPQLALAFMGLGSAAVFLANYSALLAAPIVLLLGAALFLRTVSPNASYPQPMPLPPKTLPDLRAKAVKPLEEYRAQSEAEPVRPTQLRRLAAPEGPQNSPLRLRVQGLVAANQRKAQGVRRQLQGNRDIPTPALKDFEARIDEVLSTTLALNRRCMAFFQVLEGEDEDRVLRQLALLEQRQLRHQTREGEADPTLDAGIRAQRASLDRLQTVDAEVGRLMAQLMTLGASLDSMRLFIIHAKLAQDMDILDGVSRVVHRLEGDVASAARMLEEEGV